MITAKRLVLLLLTGLLMASIACGAVSSVNPFSATPVPTYDPSKPRPTDTPWPTLPADYFKKTPIPTVGYIKKQGNTPPPPPPTRAPLPTYTPAPPIRSYGNLHLITFKLTSEAFYKKIEAVVHNRGNSRGRVCVNYDLYEGSFLVGADKYICFDVPAGTKQKEERPALDGTRLDLLGFGP